MSTGRVTAKNSSAVPTVRLPRLLVATDFSAGARAALEYALSIGKPFASKIFLVHAIPIGVLQYVSPEGSQEVISRAKQFAEQEMRRLVQDMGSPGGVQFEVLSDGGVWPLLREFIKSHEIDLLILGTHGRTGTQKELLGPVAEEIFRLAECPVLTVGSQPGAPPFSNGVRRILYATNFKPHAERASNYAYTMERELGAKLTVLHVVEDQHDAAQGGHEIVRDFIVNRMKRGIPAVCVGNCEPDFQVRFGDAGEEILRAAREEKADLIVLGLRSGKGDLGSLPSAVAYKLVCQAPCPVLTTRQ